ncbi:MAG: hypothetical protein CYPHOPRED_000826 [Cyphobasidiales sp. Tagirdzhanova-0007]|nr:MAG: hypothetical protein CYPHOPRED_000826 [Cyphobasidiales sp. Tagirdzhanova-0007]
MSKSIQTVRLLVPAARSTPSPPVGPALGARGIKSIDFCKEFNAKTQHLTPGTPTPVKLLVDTSNRSFTFTIKSPPTSWLLMKAAGVEKGSGTPPSGKALIMLGNAPNPALPQDVHVSTTGFKEIGTISLKHIYEISKIKKGDDHMKHIGLEELAKSIMGTCKNIGIRVVR